MRTYRVETVIEGKVTVTQDVEGENKEDAINEAEEMLNAGDFSQAEEIDVDGKMKSKAKKGDE